MVFINKNTGNKLTVRNAKTAALMRGAPDTYTEVKAEAPDAAVQSGNIKLSKNLTKDTLEAIALEEGVDLSECTNNDQRRAAIELARENRAQ